MKRRFSALREWAGKPGLWLYQLGVRDLMLYIIIGMSGVYVCDFMGMDVSSAIMFNRDLVLRGQLWRLITFIFVPPSSSIFFAFITLYFYLFIGRALSGAWGSVRFNNYYLAGILCQLVAGFITGYCDGTYLNMSLYFAFASLYPNEYLTLFFLIPVKVKWLALVSAAYQIYLVVIGTWSMRIGCIAGLAHFLLFFSGTIIRRLRNDSQYWDTRRNFRRTMRGR